MVGTCDPVTFQIIRHRLLRILDEAVIALKNVSGSPITNEGHDMMVALYRADGSLMVGGAGYGEHMATASQAVKYLIAHFSDDPGIFEDDVYFCNDSYTAALHPPDVYLISPVHFRGTLTGFVANFVHLNDIGAIDPGGFCPNARESYQEGFQTKGLKIVERGRLRRDVVDTFLNMVRDPGMAALDLKSQLAANHVAKERMGKLYQDYGLVTVEAVAERLIQQSESLVRERLRELPDGKWQARQYVDLPKGDVLKIELTAIKERDVLTYDFTGTDRQVDLGINCCYWATWGSIFAPIFPVLAWDVVWNDGVLRPFRLIAPEGSTVNCTRPAPISVATVGNVQIINNLSSIVLGKMLGASEKYRDRAMAVWRGSHAGMHLHGLNSQGEPFVMFTTDSFGGAGGARSSRDGVDVGGDLANPISRIANAEQHELYAPMLYLFRRAVPDSGGPGRWRGGVCHEYALKPHGARHIGGITFGKAVHAPMAYGLFGGYPGSHVAYYLFRDGAVDDLPGCLEAIGGNREDRQWSDFELGESDVMYIRNIGSGGYGDPLERDLEAVLGDVLLGTVSPEAAQQVYGVIVDLAQEQVDERATTAQQARIRAERLGARSSVGSRREIPRTHKPLAEYLQIDGDRVQCTHCGAHLASVSQPWKDVVPRRRLPTSAAGAHRDGGDRFFLCQYYCPSCATVLETEVLHRDDRPTYDAIGPWPE